MKKIIIKDLNGELFYFEIPSLENVSGSVYADAFIDLKYCKKLKKLDEAKKRGLIVEKNNLSPTTK